MSVSESTWDILLLDDWRAIEEFENDFVKMDGVRAVDRMQLNSMNSKSTFYDGQG